MFSELLEILLTVVIFALGLITSVLGLILYIHQRHTSMLVFIVGGFLLAFVVAIHGFISIISPRKRMIPILVQLVASCYYLATGVVFIVAEIRNNYIARTPHHWEVVIPVLFIVNIVFITITMVLQIVSYAFTVEDYDEHDTESSDVKTLEPALETQSVTKKISDQTLIGNHHTTQTQLKHTSQETAELAFYLNKSIDKENLNYTEHNWMDSTPNLHTIHLPVMEAKETMPFKQRKLSIFNKPGALMNEYELKYARSVPNFLRNSSSSSIKPESDKFVEMKSSFHQLNNSKLRENGSKTSLGTIETKDSERRVSLIESSFPSNNTLDKLNTLLEDDRQDTVKRSKSTSWIGKQRKEQRWKSINDERVFLSNVNESLLPPVLRQGESPIMESKRKQEMFAGSQDTLVTPKENYSEIDRVSTPITENNSNYVYLSPVGEASTKAVDSAEDLPYEINEFSEPPPPADHFGDFDQGYQVKPKKKGVYNFTQGPYEEEEYSKTLNGLEEIPKPAHANNWMNGHRAISNPRINSISLQEWDSNSNLYEEQRTRSGINLNMGITRLISDSNLEMMKSNLQDGHNQMLSIPSNTERLDDIDELSDIHSTTGSVARNPTPIRRPSYNLLNRSFSAPSLHTFRNVSQNSGTSSHEKYSHVTHEHIPEYLNFHLEAPLTLCRTPPPPEVSSTSSSPIKKFLQESPRRISSVFKRRSVQRNSMDNYELGHHKHSLSVVSNQISLSSLVSSKSGSPRKSIKSLLTSRSHHHSLSVQSLQASRKASMMKGIPPVKSMPAFTNYTAPLRTEEAIDFWDLDTAPSSNRSRVSSVPSAVIGEYDREKWRTLKVLQDQEKTAFST